MFVPTAQSGTGFVLEGRRAGLLCGSVTGLSAAGDLSRERERVLTPRGGWAWGPERAAGVLADGHGVQPRGHRAPVLSFLMGEESEAPGFGNPHGAAAGTGAGLHLGPLHSLDGWPPPPAPSRLREASGEPSRLSPARGRGTGRAVVAVPQAAFGQQEGWGGSSEDALPFASGEVREGRKPWVGGA